MGIMIYPDFKGNAGFMTVCSIGFRGIRLLLNEEKIWYADEELLGTELVLFHLSLLQAPNKVVALSDVLGYRPFSTIAASTSRGLRACV